MFVCNDNVCYVERSVPRVLAISVYGPLNTVVFRPRSCTLFKPKHANRQEPIKKPIRLLAEKHGLFKFIN